MRNDKFTSWPLISKTFFLQHAASHMGIRDLSKLIDRFAPRATRSVFDKEVRGMRWAIDANLFMYRFMTAKPHIEGRHVERFRRFVDWLRSMGVVPTFVFDGESPELKTLELKTRREQKKKATNHLRDLQQGITVLQHLDWRWWQLTVVLRSIALINSPRIQPIIPVRVAAAVAVQTFAPPPAAAAPPPAAVTKVGGENNDDDGSRSSTTSTSRELPAPEEPNVALGALFQLLAETLEWGTEAFLPNRLIQNLVDQSFLVHELPRDQLPPLIRFVAQTRLRRHTPHMVELDWMHDPSEALIAAQGCPCFNGPFETAADQLRVGGRNSCNILLSRSTTTLFGEHCENGRESPTFVPTTMMTTSASVPALSALRASLNDSGDGGATHSTDGGVVVKLPPVVIIGGGEDGEEDDDIVKERTGGAEVKESKGVSHQCNCATANACRGMTGETLEALLQESLNRNTRSQDIFRPFLVCAHCTRAVAMRLLPIAKRYRARSDAAWQNPSNYTFLVLIVVHDAPDSEGQWLLPSAAVAQHAIPRWQEAVPWPNKMQEKIAKGANFDYYNWICSARSSAWWFEMQSQSKKEDEEEGEGEEEERSGEEEKTCDSASLSASSLSTRVPCRFESELFTCAAATLTNQAPDLTTSKASKNRARSTASSLENEWERFRAEQQKQRLDALESRTDSTFDDEAEEEGGEEEEGEEEEEGTASQTLREKGVRPVKHRFQCLESPEQRSMLMQQMEQQIATLEPQVTRVTGEQLEEVRQYLRSENITVLTAEHEAEATCARLCRAGLADWVVSEDFDAMPFGAQKMLRHLAWSYAVLGDGVEQREVTGRGQKVGELVDLNTALSALNVSAREFVDLCILCGCDFCTGLQDCNYVTARDIIQKYGSLENVVRKLDPRGRFAKGLRLFNLENALEARKLFMDNHTDVLPQAVCEQLGRIKE